MKKPEHVDPLAETRAPREDKASEGIQSEDETVQFRTPSLEELEAQAAREKTPKV